MHRAGASELWGSGTPVEQRPLLKTRFTSAGLCPLSVSQVNIKKKFLTGQVFRGGES